jgi:hypothetical protein
MANNATFTEEVKSVNNFYIIKYGLILAMLFILTTAYCVLYKYIAAASSRYPNEPILVMLLSYI